MNGLKLFFFSACLCIACTSQAKALSCSSKASTNYRSGLAMCTSDYRSLLDKAKKTKAAEITECKKIKDADSRWDCTRNSAEKYSLASSLLTQQKKDCRYTTRTSYNFARGMCDSKGAPVAGACFGQCRENMSICWDNWTALREDCVSKLATEGASTNSYDLYLACDQSNEIVAAVNTCNNNYSNCRTSCKK